MQNLDFPDARLLHALPSFVLAGHLAFLVFAMCHLLFLVNHLDLTFSIIAYLIL